MEGPLVTRFAPSATGHAHPGTLAAGLLNWLDARSLGAQALLRLEDLDPQRASPRLAQALIDEFAWFGLSWDGITRQSERVEVHRDGLRQLMGTGRVYRCTCSRAQIRAAGVPASDGGVVYPGTCRSHMVRSLAEVPRPGEACLRLRLDDRLVRPSFEGAHDPAQNPARALGDPVIWRRDGVPSYHLASVCDDADSGVRRIVRGVDLLPSTALQTVIADALGFKSPEYRHHPLLLEAHGQKFAKFHQAIAVPELMANYDGPSLCGFLAKVLGLRDVDEPTTPEELLVDFSWNRVVVDDQVVHISGGHLGHQRMGE